MIRKHKLYSLLIVAVGLMTVFSQVALAQPPKPTSSATQIVAEFEITGIIEAINPPTITVSGLTINLSLLQFSMPLIVGDIIKVDGAVLSTGQFAAAELELGDDIFDDDSDDDDDSSDDNLGKVKLTGVITAMDDDSITIGSIKIDIRKAQIDPGALVVGQEVQVKLSVDVDGSLIAQHVEFEDDDDRRDDDDDDERQDDDDSDAWDDDDDDERQDDDDDRRNDDDEDDDNDDDDDDDDDDEN